MRTVSFKNRKHQKRLSNNLELQYPLAYQSWCSMKRRCYDPNYHSYKHYGKLGITVCQDWLVFSNFVKDMGEPGKDIQGKRLTLSRNTNTDNYNKDTCTWATNKEQNRNR